MKIIRGILTTLLTIVFALLLLVTLIVGIGKTFIAKEYVLGKLKSTELYNEINKSANSIVEEYITEDNPNKEILEQFVEDENIDKLIDEFVGVLYENENIDSEAFKNILNKNMDNIVKKYDIDITETQKEEIDSVINDVSDEFGVYDNDEEFQITQEESIEKNKFPEIKKIVDKVAIFSILLTIVVGFLVILLNIKESIFALKCLASASISTSIFMVVMSVLLSKASTLVGSENEIANSFVKDLLSDISTKIMNISIIVLVISLIIIIVPSIVKKFKHKEEVL